MLPSTGYFKTINCPFYENGTCDRPYCHFKHSRRDGSNAGVVVGAPEVRSAGQNEASKVSDSEVLQQLVTEAVKKVLADREVTDTTRFPTDVVSQVGHGLPPTVTSVPTQSSVESVASKGTGLGDVRPQINKPVPCVYNPTPIAELKKRHIPIISYMPTRERGVAVKRKSSPDGAKPWLTLGTESSDARPPVRYKPTAIVNADDSVQTYVPTCKSDSLSSNSYEDGNSNDCLKPREPYYPRSKKRREEYVPKKVKAPLKTVGPFSEQFGMLDELLTATRVPDDESQDSCLEFEPKFSDDDNDEQILRRIQNQDQEGYDENHTDYPAHAANKSTNESESISDDRKLFKTGETVGTSTLESKLVGHKFENEGTAEHEGKLESSGVGKKESSNEKNGVENIEKQSSKSRSGSENRKTSSTSKSNEGYKTESVSTEKRSTSRNTEKESRRGSRDSKRKEERGKKNKGKEKDEGYDRHKRDKDRQRDKDRGEDKDGRRNSRGKDKGKDKKDYRNRRSVKRHEQSKRNNERKEKNDEGRKRESRSKRKSTESKESSEKSKKRKENSEERYLSDRSVSSLGSMRSFLDDSIFSDENYKNNVDEVLSVSDSDHDVQEECLKIFQEYQVSEGRKTISTKETKPNDQTTEQVEEIGRKRVAHPSATTVCRQHSVSQPSRKSVNPHEKMYERWRLTREAAVNAGNAKKIVENSVVVAQPLNRRASTTSTPSNIRKSTEATYKSDLPLNGNGRIRIAHVPYARSLAMEKRKVTENVGKSAESNSIKAGEKTAAQTAKSGVRVAHVPQVVPQLVRPEPLQVTTQKFPLNVRQYYVNIMHDVCVQIYTNAEDSAQRAVREEFSCHERCKALAVYKNSCMLAAHRLRKEVDQNQSECSASGGTLSMGGSMVSHEAVLTGKSKGSWSVLKTKRSVTEFRGASLYGMLRKWILTEQQLRDNGFPRPHLDGQKGRAHVYVTNSRNQSVLSKVPNERICSRCGKAYMVDKNGFPVRQQNCIHHWGRKFTIRGEGKYSCCQQYGWADGCCEAKTHVWDYTDYENLRGYVKTLPKDADPYGRVCQDIPVEEQGVYALDCEMCYTTQGLELTRITVIDQDSSVVYETLVRPHNPIIDYNTRFSGITEEHMKDVTTSLLDVQATLLTMFSDKSILVGHSLESDFKALRLLHDTVVDTSVMFPHKNGYPHKRALKNLCSEYLRKIIQNDVGGHDSKEDAVSCMELILWKAKEEAKLQ